MPKIMFMTKAEVDALKDFCDDNLAVGQVEILQSQGSGIGTVTKVQVKDLLETMTDITDTNSW